MSDFIERDSLIRKCFAMVKEPWNHEAAPSSWADAYKQFIEDIEEAEAAEVNPDIHGSWLVKPLYKGSEASVYVCSVCNEPFWWNTMSFCPNCGARMDLEDT